MKMTLPLLTAGFLLASCSGNSEQEKAKATVESTTQNEETSADEDFVLPQPITLVHAFKDAGLTYAPNKTNPASAKDSYSLKVDQLLNLGVYSTDLAYCAIHNKTQEARTYLSTVQALGSKVGLKSVFSDKAMIEKFDKNLDNPEAIEELITEVQEKLDTYLEDNDLRHIATVQFAGAWVEGLYLGIDDYKKKNSIGEALADQMALLKNILTGLNNQSSKDARLQEIIGKLNGLLTTYEGFTSVKNASENKNNPVPQLTPEEFDQLAAGITALRTNIVSPSKK